MASLPRPTPPKSVTKSGKTTTPRPPTGAPKPPTAKMNTFKKPAAQHTPGVIDHPKSYQKRHPNAILSKGPGGTATVKGRRTPTGLQLRAPMSPVGKVPTRRSIGY